MSNICKKCLIGQQAEDYLRMIEKSKAAIRPKDRTPDERYAQRIAVCESCEHLKGPTCMACGCYVELRALRSNVKCPYRKW